MVELTLITMDGSETAVLQSLHSISNMATDDKTKQNENNKGFPLVT